MRKYQENLRVGIIQTTLNNNLAWAVHGKSFPQMNAYESERVWTEAMQALGSLCNMPDNKRPHVILLPEFGVSLEHEKDLHSFADKAGSIIISGLDFQKVEDKVKNEAVVSIPFNWPFNNGTSEKQTFHFGKRHPAWREREFIEKHQTDDGKTLSFYHTNTVYILDLGEYGRVGLVICADFYDIERYLIYQGEIQHLLIIAYNQDTESFNHLAEAVSRLIFCNVVICNTGFHGGSMAFSPRKKPFERIIYSHRGTDLFTFQTIDLPIKTLVEAQSKGYHKNYKSLPPGYLYKGSTSSSKEVSSKAINTGITNKTQS